MNLDKRVMERRETRILFATPHCLLDTTNGGAIQMRALLVALHECGFRCEVVSGSFFMSDVREQRLRALKARRSSHEPCYRVRDEGVEHRIFASQTHDYLEPPYLRLLTKRLDVFRPDLVMIWGRGQSERAVERAARARGIPTMLHHMTTTLPPDGGVARRATMVVVPSEFLRRHFEQATGVRARVLYPFRLGRGHIAAKRRGRYVTFINPAPEKGLGLVCRLVERAYHELPDVRFLLVEGRWTRTAVDATGVNLSAFPNVRYSSNMADVKRIYAKTRVLLVPSLWLEAFGMVVVEAHANGIPVVACDIGGIGEAMAGAGVLISPPTRSLQDFGHIATSREVDPWMRALKRLLSESAYRRESKRARQAAKRFSSARTVPEALALVYECMAGTR